MIVTRIDQNLISALSFMAKRGIHVPVINGLQNVGWSVIDCKTLNQCGAVVIVPSTDGEDVEMYADGGWTVPSAKLIMDAVFNQFGHYRLTAKCLKSNVKNIRVLRRMGFVVEGEKRCDPENYILLGMLKSECRLLKGS